MLLAFSSLSSSALLFAPQYTRCAPCQMAFYPVSQVKPKTPLKNALKKKSGAHTVSLEIVPPADELHPRKSSRWIKSAVYLLGPTQISRGGCAVRQARARQRQMLGALATQVRRAHAR